MERTFQNIEYIQPIGITKEASNLCISFSNAYNNYIGTSIIISKKMGRLNYRKFIYIVTHLCYFSIFLKTTLAWLLFLYPFLTNL